MQYDQSVLTKTEKRIFALRTLYSKYSYSPYRMSKFAEYDLYSRHKDFLLSDRVIAFTDTNGKLKALKPDVTLSLVENSKDEPQKLQKLYYDENVYRVSDCTNSFREIMQMGLECIGAVDRDCVSEVIKLAAESLNLVAEGADTVLLLSDQDILTLTVDALTDSKSVKEELLKLAGEKNLHEIEACCIRNEIDKALYSKFLALLELHGEPDAVMPQLKELCQTEETMAVALELEDVLNDFSGTDLEKFLRLDFSLISDTGYYNGITFTGYIDGVPEQVLVGGQYDMLMKKLKKKSRAIGFAVYMDALSRLGRAAGNASIEYFYENAVAPFDEEEGE